MDDSCIAPSEMTTSTQRVRLKRENQDLKGVIPRTFDHIFEAIETIADMNFRAWPPTPTRMQALWRCALLLAVGHLLC